jgi:hypothetical protein
VLFIISNCFELVSPVTAATQGAYAGNLDFYQLLGWHGKELTFPFFPQYLRSLPFLE